MFVLLIFLILLFELKIYLTHNFASIISGRIYRSAQLTVPEFNYYVKKYHIKTIVNLRGNNEGSDWYDNEIEFSREHHVKHVDIKLKAYKLPNMTTLQDIVTVLKNVPQPILIHCRSGVDRTGLAAAIAIAISGSQSIDKMDDEISWRHNVLSPRTVGYQVMANYLNYLKSYHVKHSEKAFLQWLYGDTKLVKDSGYFLT